MQVPISSIRLPARLRVVSEKTCHALADSMNRDGQFQAVTIAKDAEGYVLIDGAHRLCAARKLNWSEIRADLLHLSAPLMAQLMEANSNLARAGDTLLSKAVLLLEGKRLYEQLYPQRNWGGDRRSTQFQTQKQQATDQEGEGSPTCWQAGEAVGYLRWMSCLQGVSERTLKEYVQIARTLGREHCQKILQATLPIANHGSHLKTLMRLQPMVREELISLMIARPNIDFPDALRTLQPPEPHVETVGEYGGDIHDPSVRKRVRSLENTFLERLDNQGRLALVRRLLGHKSTKFSRALEANGYRLAPIQSAISSRMFEDQNV